WGGDEWTWMGGNVCSIKGVICISSTFPVLELKQFPIVILDEASQLQEPLGLIPLVRSRCQDLVVVGDPPQLPPTMAAPAKNPQTSLDRTLFDRFVSLGMKPIMLRTQYRVKSKKKKPTSYPTKKNE